MIHGLNIIYMLHIGSHSTPLTSKISGGVQENLDLFAVIFADNNVIKCIGYIISWRVVLGAAQCFFGKGLSNFTVSRSFDYVNGEPSCGKSEQSHTTFSNAIMLHPVTVNYLYFSIIIISSISNIRILTFQNVTKTSWREFLRGIHSGTFQINLKNVFNLC